MARAPLRTVTVRQPGIIQSTGCASCSPRQSTHFRPGMCAGLDFARSAGWMGFPFRAFIVGTTAAWLGTTAAWLWRYRPKDRREMGNRRAMGCTSQGPCCSVGRTCIRRLHKSRLPDRVLLRVRRGRPSTGRRQNRSRSGRLIGAPPTTACRRRSRNTRRDGIGRPDTAGPWNTTDTVGSCINPFSDALAPVFRAARTSRTTLGRLLFDSWTSTRPPSGVSCMSNNSCCPNCPPCTPAPTQIVPTPSNLYDERSIIGSSFL